MRRKERQVTDNFQIIEILENNDVCRIALKDEEGLYIVPLNYGYEFIEDKLILFFHGAKEGRKANIFYKGNQEVAFEIDEKVKLEGTDDIACTYTYYYKSIIGVGNASIVENRDDKLHALKLIMKSITKKDDFKYNDNSINNVLVMKIEVNSFSAKIH
ncbi:MAG: pyridoxamine 5'-phosphate oxidase family protein [Spirochaetia bacterium]|nr:pyridoxamine 5'-phosphate oxidase family protein [Spirochaetia bacterium]